MKLSHRLEREASVLCTLGSVATLLAVYAFNWTNPSNSYWADATVGMTLHQLGTLRGVPGTYAIATWAMTTGAVVTCLMGLALGLPLPRGVRLADSLAVGVCGTAIIGTCIAAGAEPGLPQASLNYPLGPGMWVGIAGAALMLIGVALSLLARRASGAPAASVATDLSTSSTLPTPA